MVVTKVMIEFMEVLNTSLAECLDDEYPDMIDRVASDYNLTDEQFDWCLENRWDYM